jgi:DNA gyrase subunit A
MKQNHPPELELPDVRDGLNVVQRRILYNMLLLRITPNRPFQRTAIVVGDTMARLHPHGDREIYEELVRMTQLHSMRYPFLEGDGEFGSPGVKAGPMRNTRVRLAKLGIQQLTDIEFNSVESQANFDNSEEEPVVLPAQIPSILINGFWRIEKESASLIPPHNLNETIDAIIAKIDNPKLDSAALLQFIKGPDFIEGCDIIETEDLRQAYLTGIGSVTCRGRIACEDGTLLRITSLPPHTKPREIVEHVRQLIGLGNLSGIASIEIEAANEIAIRLEPGANANTVSRELYAKTDAQRTFRISFVALSAGGKQSLQGLGKRRANSNAPARINSLRTLSLADIIEEFIMHRVEVTLSSNMCKFERSLSAAQIAECLVLAANNLQEVTNIIHAAPSEKEAKTRLKDRFNLNDRQLKALMKCQLQEFTQKKRNAKEKTLYNLKTQMASCEAPIESREALLNLIKLGLLQIKESFGDSRRSRLLPADQ